MQAIRHLQEIDSQTITIHLPLNFIAKRVEIIVLPLEAEEPEVTDVMTRRERLRKALLAAPTLSAKEIQEFHKARKWLNR